MRNKILKISVGIIIVAALGGFWGYNHYFKPDPEIQQELTNQFGSDFFNSFDYENEGGDSESVSDPQEKDPVTGLADASATKGNLSVDNPRTLSGNQQSSPSTTGKGTEVKPQITQQTIINKYQPKFDYLQNVALSRLDTLYSAAVQEYKQSKKAGTLKRSEFVQKYIQAGTMLEANVDSQFYSTLNAMKSDLIANNLSTDIISDTEKVYEKTKSSKRSQLLAKINK
ncbi:hypothetical protein Desor_4055 [Desulfosporosinus orientis DSM 765]|uniref:Uncharacterized protein n=1 Tax=Desulfosporosinus orientis (strain ATCC 19365 / DSM 765 / NCIMB 8382 / VKM B-1628 / Singapore I) TaxID=768706 RepID=G7WFY2_DESOD|nr:hypothetical protein [Desulfosporosinus orientis]AET69497.1 hypothetical protein Desor_4055 [Desulfosporosinus orientis DSM 765]